MKASATLSTLRNPPIVEAILDIDCDLPPSQDLEKIEAPAIARYSERYPKLRIQYFQEHRLEAAPNAEPKISVGKHGRKALQFVSDDEKQLVQVRAEGFTFNRLTPYTSLDDYLPEIKRTWDIYASLTNPIQIRVIRLRYINRILLPAHDNRVQLDTYFKVAPHLPDESDLMFVGFLNQHIAIQHSTGYQVTTGLASQPQEADKIPIVFDNGVACPEAGPVDDWPWILSKLEGLRDLKNLIFEQSLTPQCLNLYL